MGSRKVKFGIVVYPGTNCDMDTHYVIKEVAGEEAQYLWHEDLDLKGSQVVVLPGGFSYGDYLRSGAIARFSPIMKKIKKFAEKGGLIIGICNGFQILLESGLLPGAMLRNRGLRFICSFEELLVENDETPFTLLYTKGERLRMPIAHIDGNYFAEIDVLSELERERRIVFRYINNPNGSAHDLAGIISKKGNVFGLMPHPERASEALLGSADGLRVFLSAAKYVRES